MERLVQLAKALKKLNYSKIINVILSRREVQKYILDLNREDQLFREGINALGEKLRSDYARFGQVYANKTINIKKEKGQPVDRITLKDTGDFYSTFVLDIDPEAFTINADGQKDDNDLLEEWPDILGLTDENMGILTKFLIIEVIPLIKERLLAND